MSSKPVRGEVHSIHHYVIKIVSDLWQVGSFLWVFRFPPPMKLTERHNWNIVESGVKHHKPNQTIYLELIMIENPHLIQSTCRNQKERLSSWYKLKLELFFIPIMLFFFYRYLKFHHRIIQTNVTRSTIVHQVSCLPFWFSLTFISHYVYSHPHISKTNNLVVKHLVDFIWRSDRFPIV